MLFLIILVIRQYTGLPLVMTKVASESTTLASVRFSLQGALVHARLAAGDDFGDLHGSVSVLTT